MAQTGYTPILLYSSSTASQAPAVGNLTNSTLGSELAINITDGKLFYKDNANAIQVIAWKITPTSAGGTGLTSYTAGDTVYYASGTTLTKLSIGASKTIMTSSGTAPQWSSSLDTTQGGTGLTSYTAGDLTYYASGTALTKLGIGTAYYQLGVNAGGTAPSWQPSPTSVLTSQGDLLYASAANTLARLAKSTTSTRYLANTGTSNNPAWSQIDLTNGVTGVLPVASGGTNASSASITAFNNITGYTASGATGTTSTNLVFSTSPSITTPALVGDSTMSTGNLIQGTAAKGINFTANTPAAGMTSQLLNWYEEGTFTPTIGGDSVAGTQTYIVQVGRYTRIGNRVNFNLRIVLSAKDAATAGNLIIGGLPFASNSTAHTFNSFAIGNAGLFTLSVLYTQLEAHIEPNLSYFYLGQIGSGQAYSYLQASAFAATSRIVVTGTYLI